MPAILIGLLEQIVPTIIKLIIDHNSSQGTPEATAKAQAHQLALDLIQKPGPAK